MLHLHCSCEIDTTRPKKRRTTPAAATVNDASPHAAWLLDTVQLDLEAKSLGAKKTTQSLPGPEVPSRIDTSLSCRREEMRHADPTGGGTTHGLA
ncbi:hypothetical protein NDU88_007157 [Pleurodeles waltl]|uniref:Uncharacterized protein n=1 Tax=Pleurodeles waltl TaxID=8319 RepID=A0AAV7SRQ4_PLEWA|nr:hypothetical protein NDU88_007157 [Pleurodeles waltl]